MDCTLWTVLFGLNYFMDCITFRIHFQLPFVSPKPLFCNFFFLRSISTLLSLCIVTLAENPMQRKVERIPMRLGPQR